MKATETFINTIACFLNKEAATDPAFALKMQKQPEKTPEAVCNFILAEVSKSRRNGYADEEIYGMARHFIDEPTLSDPGTNNAVSRVIVNTHVSLTQEEKKKAYREAVALYQKRLEDNAVAQRKQAKAKKQASLSQQPALMGDLFGGQY